MPGQFAGLLVWHVGNCDLASRERVVADNLTLAGFDQYEGAAKVPLSVLRNLLKKKPIQCFIPAVEGRAIMRAGEGFDGLWHQIRLPNSQRQHSTKQYTPVEGKGERGNVGVDRNSLSRYSLLQSVAVRRSPSRIVWVGAVMSGKIFTDFRFERTEMVATAELRETDDKGRVTLPRGFANATLLIEQVSDVELVIRKAKVVPLAPGGDEELFLEERPIVLTPEQQRAFFEVLMSPPKPNAALKKLMRGTGPKPAAKKTKRKKAG